MPKQVAYATPVIQADIPHTTSIMQSAIAGVLAPFQPLITSAMHGEHVTDSAHYQGRAVDVGAFGGTSVGYNPTTWNAITKAISSGQFQKIGTLGKLANNPTLQKFAEQHGVGLFEDEGSGPHVHFQVAPGNAVATTGGGERSSSNSLSGTLVNVAQQYGIPPQIALAMMGTESSGNVSAVSDRGAVGLLQLMPGTAKEMGVTDSRDPIQNIHGGLKYLAQQFQKFRSWPLALAAYNAGPTAVADAITRTGNGLNALNLPHADPQYVNKILGAAQGMA